MCFARMVKHFVQHKIDYHIVRIIPFVHTVEGNVPNVNNPCVVYGTLGSQNLAFTMGWEPGVWFSDGLSESVVKNKLGNLYLNHDCITTRMTAVLATVEEQGWHEFFIKPCSDTKEFPGKWTEKLWNVRAIVDISD